MDSPISPSPASFDDIAAFHDSEYLEFLLNVAPQLQLQLSPTNARGGGRPKNKVRKPTQDELELLDEYGLVDDTPPFSALASYVQYTCGATLAAADAISLNGYPLAIAWDGGRHHARRSKAGGFCHANDLVLAIQRLLAAGAPVKSQRHRTRVMYLDLDVHFGDGVFEAFQHTTSVLCASVHVGIPGFYPPCAAISATPALGTAIRENLDGLRIGTKPGLSDASLFTLLAPLKKAFDTFQPDFLVIQAGADGLSRDPLAGSSGWSLSSGGFADAVSHCVSWALARLASERPCPVLVTGGGGYSSPDVARAWCEVTRRCLALLGTNVEKWESVPEHALLNAYASDGYSMTVDPGNKEDENLREVDVLCCGGGGETVERIGYLEYLVKRAEEDLEALGLGLEG